MYYSTVPAVILVPRDPAIPGRERWLPTPRVECCGAPLGARVPTRYFILLNSTKTPAWKAVEHSRGGRERWLPNRREFFVTGWELWPQAQCCGASYAEYYYYNTGGYCATVPGNDQEKLDVLSGVPPPLFSPFFLFKLTRRATTEPQSSHRHSR